MSVVVLRGGMQTTIQDLGRPGFGRFGVPAGGALDSVSLRIANMLAGNSADAAALECAFVGPHLRFERGATIALCGAEIDATIDGRAVRSWSPIEIAAGAELRIGIATRGARAYLAIAGGIDVPRVLGGRGTHLRSRFGGLDGRVLRAGDRILIAHGGLPRATGSGAGAATASCADDAVASEAVVGPETRPVAPRTRVDAAPRHAVGGEPATPHRSAGWSVARDVRTPLGAAMTVRVVATRAGRGRIGALTERTHTVSPRSDRMGIRLAASIGTHDASIVSGPTAIGAIQLPPDGCPIVLMNDAATTGGYPIVAVVASVDLPTLGQARPGATLRFEEITIREAQGLAIERELAMRRLARAIAIRRSE